MDMDTITAVAILIGAVIVLYAARAVWVEMHR